MDTIRLTLLATVLILGCFVWGAGRTQAEVLSPSAPLTTIGTGTAASCQTNEASNAFSAAVAAGGTVDFNCGPELVIINVTTSVVDQQVTVNGRGLIILSGEDLRQLFIVDDGGHLTLNDLGLSRGASSNGGALYLWPQASATINRSSLSSNRSTGDGGAIHNRGTLTINDSIVGSNITGVNGGGIFNNGGTVTIRRSYLVSNQAHNANGGAIYSVNGQVTLEQSAVRSSIAGNLGGGIFVASPATIVNTTFSNNRAAKGGALFLIHHTAILNSTFNENRADLGGAIWREPSSDSTIKNSIVAGSRTTNNGSPSLNCDGPPLASLGRNIISDGTCVSISAVDYHNTDPLLGAWLASGVRAYVPQVNSAAIDFGLDCPGVDQRGFPRPLPAGGACDTGSIEVGGIVYLPIQMK
jgi:hypothetical protein